MDEAGSADGPEEIERGLELRPGLRRPARFAQCVSGTEPGQGGRSGRSHGGEGFGSSPEVLVNQGPGGSKPGRIDSGAEPPTCHVTAPEQVGGKYRVRDGTQEVTWPRRSGAEEFGEDPLGFAGLAGGQEHVGGCSQGRLDSLWILGLPGADQPCRLIFESPSDVTAGQPHPGPGASD